MQDANAPLSEEQALDWLRARGRVRASDAELGRCWGGWHRQRVGRRLDAWSAAGHIRRRGKTVTVLMPEDVTNGGSEGVTNDVTGEVTNRALVPVTSRKFATSTQSSKVVKAALADWQAAPAAPTSEPVEIMPPATARASISRILGAAILIIIALAIGALALVINGQTGYRFGTTSIAAMTFTGMSLAADLLAIVLPATAAALWHGRRRALASACWATWLAATSLAALASLGFVELHISDTAAGRAAIVATAAATTDQRMAAIEAARSAADAARRVREGECARRGPLCRDREADERVALATLNSAIAVPVPAAATIADADPQVTAALRLATWVGLKVAVTDVVNARLALMALLPNIAGLVLAFGMGLAQSRR
jgi:hypothetical protein